MRLGVLIATIMMAMPAAAEDNPWCQQLWLDRNTVMDRAGQCFGSALGQAVFDNSDCTPGQRPLSPLDTAIVTQIQQMEASGNCAVDTSVQRLMPEVLEHRARLLELWTVPIRAETEHFCGGYSGPAIDLHAGISTSTSIIGRLEPGQGFGFSYDPMPPNWEYITVTDADHNRVAHGWAQGLEMRDDLCAFMAG